jgi:transposase-like protein
MFPDNESCENYLFKLKWKNGFVCLKCKNTEAWKNKRGHYICTKCEHEHSVTSQTIFHGTHKKLKYWFKAVWWFTSTKSGISAVNLKNLLGISYPTAWCWLQKLKRSCVRPDRTDLSGDVEVDEFYLGGKSAGKRGRGSENKKKLVIAVERRESGKRGGTITGRIRIKVINDCTAHTLTTFIKENIERKSKIITDKWKSYNQLKNMDFKHSAKKSSENISALRHVHIVISLINRWVTGTLQTRISEKHLQEYMDEFVFRFNRRNLSSIGNKFYSFMKLTVVSNHYTYNQIIEKLQD